MTFNKLIDLITQIDGLNIVNNDLNSADRLELLKKVSVL